MQIIYKRGDYLEYTKSKIIEETLKILEDINVKGVSTATSLITTYNMLNNVLQLCRQEEGEKDESR